MQRGRPRKTDPDEALRTAMRIFWEKGFEGTSMADLAAATGMAKPGLYATFGDKETLYAKALTHYYQALGGPLLDDLVGSPDPLRVVLRRCLEAVARSAIDRTCPGGCFVLNSMMESAGQSGPHIDLAKTFDRKRRDAFARRFRAARSRGELPEEADVKGLAEFFSGQLLALAALGRSGASRKALERFIDVAMGVLPEPDPDR